MKAVVGCCLLVIGCSIPALGQNTPPPFEENDTAIIISKNKGDSLPNYVFIDKRKDSPYYPRYSGSGSSDLLVNAVQGYVNDLSIIRHVPIRHFDLPAELKKMPDWKELLMYRDSFYTYRPCDGISYSSLEITDSCIINWSADPSVFAITSVKRKSASEFVFGMAYVNYFNGDSLEKGTLTVIIVNEETNAAVFTFDFPKERERHLMVPRQNERSYRIIVNLCRNKEPEFGGDPIAYEMLIRKRKKK